MVCLMFIFFDVYPKYPLPVGRAADDAACKPILGRKAAIVIEIIAICFIVYLIADLVISCRAEPI